MRATNGRPRPANRWKKIPFSARASSSRTPNSTSMPAARNRSAPPRASGFGSGTATTTRATPARISASAHGGCFPWWLQGSSVTTTVAPRASAPARAKATASAWGPPNSACHPSATTRSPCRIRAPTIGLGETLPHPIRASSKALPMASKWFTDGNLRRYGGVAVGRRQGVPPAAQNWIAAPSPAKK